MKKPNPLWALAAAAATLLLVGVTSRPPAPLPEDASARLFSAGRARKVLDRLVGDGRSHPIGSAANAAVRERITASLRELGYEVEVEAGLACGDWGVCGRVENVVAWYPTVPAAPAVPAAAGDAGKKGVLLVTHYDSVPAGPGVADDLSGVAIALESARALAAERHPNPVLFLFSDGEEAGLLGAEAFASSSRHAPRVGAVVNLEARGTSGESFLFETSDDNAWLVSRVARALDHPATSSLFYAVYKALPNDTDFTVLRRRGWPGVNFAFIGSAGRYHTPGDDAAALRPATLQHQGENALAAVRALADTDLAAPRKGNAVWFSLFGRWIVSWPAGRTVPLALANLALLLFALVLSARRSALAPRGFLGGVALLPAALLLAGALGWGASRLLAARWGDPAWIASPLPVLLAAWCGAFGGTAVVARLVGARYGAEGVRAGTATWFALLAVAAAFLSPDVSFLVLVPGIVLAAGLLAGRTPSALARWDAAAAVASGAVLFPVAWLLYDAMGLPILPGIALLVALASTSFVASLGAAAPRWRILPHAAGAVALAALAVAFCLPARGPDAPAHLNVVHLEREGAASWLVPERALRSAPALAGAAKWSRPPSSPIPFFPRARFLAAPASPAGAARPRIDVVGDVTAEDTRRLTLRVLSPRGAERVRVAFEDRTLLRSIAVEGRTLPALDRQVKRLGRGWAVVSLVTVRPEGVLVELALRRDAPLRGWLLDEASALPEGGRALQEARDRAATPADDGDRSLVLVPFAF